MRGQKRLNSLAGERTGQANCELAISHSMIIIDRLKRHPPAPAGDELSDACAKRKSSSLKLLVRLRTPYVASKSSLFRSTQERAVIAGIAINYGTPAALLVYLLVRTGAGVHFKPEINALPADLAETGSALPSQNARPCSKGTTGASVATAIAWAVLRALAGSATGAVLPIANS